MGTMCIGLADSHGMDTESSDATILHKAHSDKQLFFPIKPGFFRHVLLFVTVHGVGKNGV